MSTIVIEFYIVVRSNPPGVAFPLFASQRKSLCAQCDRNKETGIFFQATFLFLILISIASDYLIMRL
jgi:hypothetical protein